MANISGSDTRPTASTTGPAAVAAVRTDPGSSYVDWGAVLAGAVVASAIAFILTAFGGALGLSLISPQEGMGLGSTGLLIAIGIWTVWVAASSNMAGAYLTGRLRRRVADATEHEVDVRDGTHGVVMWGVTVLVTAVLLAGGAATTARVGAEAAGAAGSAAATAVEEAGPDLRYLADTLLRPEAGQPGTMTGSISGQGGQAGAGPDAGERVARILENVGDEGLAEEDRGYLARLVADRTGMTPEQAEERIDATLTRYQAMEQEIQDAADAARRLSVAAAFLLAASLLIAGAGAWFAAQMGGQHRDEQTVLTLFGRRR